MFRKPSLLDSKNHLKGFATISLFAFNLRSVCSLANEKSFKTSKSSSRIVKWDSSRRGKADGSVSHRWRTSWNNRTLVVIIKGDVGKTFTDVEFHTENNRHRFLNEKSPNGARHLQTTKLPSRGISHHLTTNKNMQKRKRLGLRTIDKNILTICKNKWIICNKWLCLARK